jgi:antitoxin component of MazEF toxin-antitoxin module
MATITKHQAVHRLTEAVRKASTDDLVEIYNELFPEKPITEDEAKEDPSTLVQKIVAHIDRGLEVEEILDLRYVILPKHRRVWFDEEEGLIHYDEEIEPVGQAD